MNYTLYETPQTLNRCYKQAKKVKQVGILVHSTGAVNRNLYRYVDASDVLGVNRYHNHWNKAEAGKCMHGFVGYDKRGVVAVAKTLPYTIACWGCGRGSRGSYNYDPTAHIQFEICQGSDTDAAYFAETMRVATEWCADICRQFGWTAGNICSHREAARAGYASNHGDPDSWMKHFGWDMTIFRTRVAELLGDATSEGGNIMASVARATIRKGAKGALVTEMQKALMARGYALPKFGADGGFGNESLAALKRFQAANGLAADGACGSATWAKLIPSGAAAVPETKPVTEAVDPVGQATGSMAYDFFAMEQRLASQITAVHAQVSALGDALLAMSHSVEALDHAVGDVRTALLDAYSPDLTPTPEPDPEGETEDEDEEGEDATGELTDGDGEAADALVDFFEDDQINEE